jgi:hypothetical protein
MTAPLMTEPTMANPVKRSNITKRKASSVTTPSSTILQYFKKATKMARDETTFGTPSTVASNELQGTPATPEDPAEMNKIANDSAALVIRMQTNGSCTPPSSEFAHHMQMSVQTPPTPDDNIVAGTPPSPQPEQMDTQTPPTGYVIKSQRNEFDTPISDEDEASFGTPPSNETDTTNRENTSTVYKTPSNTSKQSTGSAPTNNPKKKKTQMYLDLGQKSFASHKICPICSSLIVHGTAEDQQNHVQICKSYKEGVTCLGFKKERCVGRFGEERIVEIRDGDVPGKKKVEDVKRIVDGELGFATSAKRDGQKDALHGMTSYLYIAKKRVVGLLLVKRINKAYELMHEKSEGRTSSISRGTKPHPAIMGIHQIWVHNLHRHKGIATKLLECARGSFTFGMVIPIEQIAFSSPTEDGVGLAKKFVGKGEKVLVYDVC